MPVAFTMRFVHLLLRGAIVVERRAIVAAHVETDERNVVDVWETLLWTERLTAVLTPL